MRAACVAADALRRRVRLESMVGTLKPSSVYRASFGEQHVSRDVVTWKGDTRLEARVPLVSELYDLPGLLVLLRLCDGSQAARAWVFPLRLAVRRVSLVHR